MPKFTSKTSSDDIAVFASSDGEALHAESTSATVAAVAGIQVNVAGTSTGAGVFGESRGGGAGIAGVNLVTAEPGPAGPGGPGGPGAYFKSNQKEGVLVETEALHSAAVAAFQRNPNSDPVTGAAIFGKHITGGTAGFFDGNVVVTGDISFPGADCAEEFAVQNGVTVEPGTVMSLGPDGALAPCNRPYERRVVGVVAGAGPLRPAIVMGRVDDVATDRQPIALVGRVYCMVDADYGQIEVGDLLTSSATQGHAMKASEPGRAFGAVIGKALGPLREGLGLIPILVTLQ